MPPVTGLASGAPANPVQQSQSSNAFMVDSLLQSDTTHKVSNFDTNATNEASATDMVDDDDEMSSYMAMANRLVTGGNAN